MSKNNFSVFEIGDQVHIRNTEISGFIDGILMTSGGVEYRFVSWDENGCRSTDWVSGFELVKN